MLTVDQKFMDYISINIDEQNPEWDSVTTYNFNDVVRYGFYLYKCVIDNNLNVIPTENELSWLFWGTSNRYGAIDLQATTTTVCNAQTKTGGLAPYDLVMEFTNNKYDVIALGGVKGNSIKIEVFDSNSILVQTIENAVSGRSCVDSWWNYYNCPLVGQGGDVEENFYFRILAVSGTIKVTVTELTEDNESSVAYVIGGNSSFIGDTLFNVNMGLTDYSVKETDDFGITTLLRRQSRELMDIDIIFDSVRVNSVKRLIRGLLGRVVLFVNDESEDSAYENLLLLGYVDDFQTVLNNGVKTQASISIEEVI